MGAITQLAKELNHIGISAYQDKIYVSGGFYNAIQTKLSNVLYAYSIKERSWEIISEMPAERAAHVMIRRGKYLHLIGGRNYQEIWSFHLENQNWEKDIIPPLPEKRDHISVLQDPDKLYVVGGRQAGITKADCWQFDFDSNQWNVFAELPSPRGGQSACLYKGQIHIAGGEDLGDNTTFGRHDIYDLTAKTWVDGTALKIPRHGFVSEMYEGKWYIFGGGKKANIKTVISTTADMEILEL